MCFEIVPVETDNNKKIRTKKKSLVYMIVQASEDLEYSTTDAHSYIFLPRTTRIYICEAFPKWSRTYLIYHKYSYRNAGEILLV